LQKSIPVNRRFRCDELISFLAQRPAFYLLRNHGRNRAAV